jgi:hypothetical protein
LNGLAVRGHARHKKHKLFVTRRPQFT